LSNLTNFLRALLDLRHLRQVHSLWQRQATRAFSLLFAIGLGFSLVVSACSSNSSSSPSPSASPAAAPAQNLVLRIGRQKLDPLTLVRAKGDLEARLKPLGVTSIEWTEFQSGPPMLEALNAGSIDLARTGDAPPVIAQAAGAPLVYVGGSAPKAKSSAVLVKQDSAIKTIADLKGKKVAFAKSSSANYLIVKVLESAGLKWEEIKPVYLSAADARSAFEQGSVDAWAVWDPFYAVAQAKAGARVLRDSNGLVANRDFYLASKSFADQHADIIKVIGEETQAVAAWADANPAQVAELLAPILKIDKSILEVVTKRRNYGFEPVTPEMVKEQQAIADTFYSLKLIPKSIQVADAVWQSTTALSSQSPR
jgi:sulfonate transport system substrate-binding protein